MKRLEQKSVIITGASRGIGKGIANVFAGEGAKVLVVSRHEESGQKTVEEIRHAGGDASFFKADISLWNDAQAMAKAAVERYKRIDILCSNAGIFPSSTIETMSEQEWDRVNAVNLKGTFLAVKACLSTMKQQNYGRIIMTSSITGPYTGFPGWAHYGATKAGILGFMRSAAIEFAPHNITINAVLPGNIRTEGLDEMGEEYILKMERTIPMGKLGKTEDIGYTALFLASDEANYITGQSIVVDGGQILPESPEAL